MSTAQDTFTANPYSPPKGFTSHHEPPEVGGARYWKCDHCGTESIYWNVRDMKSEIVHSEDCDNPVIGDSDE